MSRCSRLPRSSQRSSGAPLSVAERRREPVDRARGGQFVIAPEEGERDGRHGGAAARSRHGRGRRSAAPVQAQPARPRPGSIPAARQTSASSRAARLGRPDRCASSQPAAAPWSHDPRSGCRAPATRSGRRSTRVAGRPACPRRPRSAPRVSANAAQRRIRLAVGEPGHGVVRDRPRQLRVAVPGQPVRRAVAVGEGAGRIVGREGLVRRRGAAPPTRRAGDRPRSRGASIRAASQPATSATARACRTNQGGGSRESRREAASTRAGTVIGSMVPTVRPGRSVGGRVAGARDRATGRAP